MKLFRFKTTVERANRTPSHFTDWYEAETLEQARKNYEEDLHRFGLPPTVKTEVAEMNPETLKPV